MTPERQGGTRFAHEDKMVIFGYIPRGCSPEDFVSVDVVNLKTGKTTLVSGVYTRQQLFSSDFPETVRADITKRNVERRIIQAIQKIIGVKIRNNEKQK